MPKRELQIPINKPLSRDAEEELVFRSPSTIPDKGLRDLLATKKIEGSNCSYYDIAPTENQAIKKGKTSFTPPLTIFSGEGGSFTTLFLLLRSLVSESGELLDRPNPFTEDILSQFDMKMGTINE